MIPLSSLVDTFQQLELQVLLQPASPTAPEQLFVIGGTSERPQPITLQLLYLPGVEDPHLLQYFAQVPVTWPADPDRLAAFLGHLNPHLPVPGFELNHDERLVYYRHVRVCADEGARGIVETALVALYLYGRFAGLVERAAEGTDAATLIQELRSNVHG